MAYYNGRPCAACKHQRIKCSPQCIFAPYFPPEQNQNFLNVKEVYGVNNVKEILSALDPKDRAAAVTSMCHEAEIRLKEPVHVSVGYVAHLQQRLKRLNTELASVYEELGSLSAGPSTGTMPRQQPAAAYGQMVYDPLQQQRRMMGVQLSSPAAVPYGAATSASHHAQMMGFGNNPSSDMRLKRLNTELASVYEELASLSAGPSTGTMPRQQPAAAYGQMVYDPLQQQRRMMGVQLSSPAAVLYGAATSASHQAQMMGFGNNPSSDMRQYADVVATTYQLQRGVQLSSSAAQMDAPAVHGRAGKQTMMGVGLGNSSPSTSGQHQHQPQLGVDLLSSLAAQMRAPARAGKQIMMGVGLGNPSSSTSGQQHYGIDVDARQYAVLVASHQHQPQPQPATPINVPTSKSSSEAPINAIPINVVFPKRGRVWTSELKLIFDDVVNELGGHAAAKPGVILQRLIEVDPTFTYQEVSSHRSKNA